MISAGKPRDVKIVATVNLPTMQENLGGPEWVGS